MKNSGLYIAAPKSVVVRRLIALAISLLILLLLLLRMARELLNGLERLLQRRVAVLGAHTGALRVSQGDSHTCDVTTAATNRIYRTFCLGATAASPLALSTEPRAAGPVARSRLMEST